ncbi:MAG: hypothetical protein NTW08_10320 [Gammaproteobacteria bacterium]|nr:hypothetical protein [Gammaproteobacteria bacterium]
MCLIGLIETRTAPLVKKILEHPFQQDLFAGRLPDDVFIRYVRKDIRYLSRQARAMQWAADRSDRPDEARQLRGVADYIRNVEQKTHLKYLQPNYPQPFFDDKKMVGEQSDEVDAYADALDALAMFAPIAVVLAGYRVCFKVFHDIGLYNNGALITSPRQKAWVESCRGPRFIAQDETMRRLTEQRATDDLFEPMVAAVERALGFELAMFESVHPQVVGASTLRFCA